AGRARRLRTAGARAGGGALRRSRRARRVGTPAADPAGPRPACRALVAPGRAGRARGDARAGGAPGGSGGDRPPRRPGPGGRPRPDPGCRRRVRRGRPRLHARRPGQTAGGRRRRDRRAVRRRRHPRPAAVHAPPGPDSPRVGRAARL
ncbi:MAG: NADH pyrophosphatase, decaps 5'-NAD modified RNA, partial [uncultured Blastococcus sp.]